MAERITAVAVEVLIGGITDVKSRITAEAAEVLIGGITDVNSRSP